MLPIKLAVLLFCCISFSPAEELEAKPTDAKVEAVETTKLTPSVEESKSKTEKRDSSDQTGTVFISNPTKETAFRPIYPAATYYAAPAESDAIFEPTTVRYTAADAAAVAAPQQQQQAFYGKSEGGSIRFGEQRHGAVRSSLPGPLRLSQHQQQQQQQHHAAPPHRFSYAVQPQVELYQRPIAKQHAPIYNYVEAEPSMYERLAPQQYQLGGASTAAAAAASLPGHRVQYIIAIPLSYMRQLQQQLGGNLLQVPSSPAPSSSSSSTTTTSTSTTTSTAAPPSTPESAIASASHPIVQLLGPLARDQPSVYHRHQYYPAEGPTAASPYAQQYLQIPASVLLAATQQLQQHHQQHQQQQQQQHQQQQQQQPQTYAKVAPTTSPVYQPFIYQSQPQFQLPRLYPAAPMIYTEQPVAQQTTLYAYPLAQQQQHHHHQQQHQQQPARLVRLGPKHGQQQHKYAAVPLAATASSVSSAPVTTATTTTATAATLVLPTATTATHEAVQQQQQQQQQQPHHSLPIVHYNPIYVQAPAEQQQQQQQQQQHQFAILPRFSNNNPKAGYNLAHESTPPIHVVRLSAANALGQHQQPIHHYHHYQPAMAQQQQQQHPHLYQPHALPVGNYIEEQPQQQHQQQQQQQQPALIPYFSHPGAVHYGTHLYHPASVAAVSAAAGTKQLQQQQQQPQQQHQQRQASEATATSGRLPGDSGVKQPTAATNIVKYP